MKFSQGVPEVSLRRNQTGLSRHIIAYKKGKIILSRNKLVYVLGGSVATIFVSSILVRSYTRSSIWIPIPSLSLTVGTISLSAVVNDIFFSLALVANSEETMVLSLSQVIRRKLTTSFSVKHGYFAPVLAIVIPRAGWALLHAYVSYTGALMPILVLSAFISGLIISYCGYNQKTRSFLICVLIHALFNISIIVASALGLI